MKNNLFIFVILIVLLLISEQTYAYDITFNQTRVNFETSGEIGKLIFTPFFNTSDNTTENITVQSIVSDFYIFPITVSPIYDAFNSSDKYVNLSLTIPQMIIPSSYNVGIRVYYNISDFKSFSFPVNISIITNYTIFPIPYMINLSSNSSNSTLDLGNVSVSEQKNLLNITLSNKGNTDINFKFSVQNKSDILYVQPSFVLQKFQNYTLNLVATVPVNHLPGQYNDTLVIEALGNISYLNFTYNIADRIIPEIQEFNVSDSEATMPSKIVVKATDNVKVDKIYIEVNNPNNENIQMQLKQEDKDTYFGYFNRTELLGNYKVSLKVVDTSGNEITNSSGFTVNQLDAVTFSPTLSMFPSNQPSGVLFEITKKTPVIIQIPVVNYQGNWTAQIDKPSGNSEVITDINSTITVDEIGVYTIKFTGNVLGNISGVLSVGYITGIVQLTPILEHKSLENITFSTTFLSYTLEQPFQTNFGDVTVDCEPLDRGNYIQSKIKCIFMYPADTTRRRLSVMLTSETYQAFVTTKDGEITAQKEINKSLSMQRWLWCFLFILSIVTSSVIFYIYPRHSSG